MFQPGTYVVYGSKGICQIMDTKTLDIEGIPKDKLYYVMQPAARPQGSVYAPVESADSSMRQVMSKAEAQSFLASIDSIAPLEIKNDKKRDEAIKECIRSCVPDELMRAIKTLYLRKLQRMEEGKRMTISDSHYMQQAEDILYEELSLSLAIPKEEMPAHIQSLFGNPQEA